MDVINFMAILPEGLSLGGIGSVGGLMGTFKTILIGLLIFIVIVTVVGIFVVRKLQNKKYNIPLVIITPRSDGLIAEVNRGVGGYFKSKKVGGITSFRIKRKGIGVVEIPPPQSSFLTSPNRTLFLAQKGIDDYEPIMPSELTSVFVSTPEGEKHVPILKLKAINQEATAWHCDNLESARKRFTFISMWDKYQGLISMMVFIFILFLILYINWIGLKDVVTGLKEVAELLRGSSAPIITPGA